MFAPTEMLTVALIDHRFALILLAALLITAAGPLAYAWAKLLPDEKPPFGVVAAGTPQRNVPPSDKIPATKDPFALILLACVTLSYVLRFPGLPLSTGLHWLSSLLPADYFPWVVTGGRLFFFSVPGLAAAYSALRPNPVRIALAAAGLCVIALWLLSPLLQKAIAEG
jgi:hypothetical protein